MISRLTCRLIVAVVCLPSLCLAQDSEESIAIKKALKISSVTFKGRPFHAVLEIGKAGEGYSGHLEVWWVDSAQRRMKQLTLLANYTYSKALDDVPNGQGNAGVAAQSLSTLPSTNPLRHQFDYGRSDYDRAHIAVISYVWDLPAFSSRNLLTREVAGGWQLTGIIRRQSGQALTATAGADRSQTGLGGSTSCCPRFSPSAPESERETDNLS
jgi:hypothetical protein